MKNETRNGFEVVTRADVLNTLEMIMGQIEVIPVIMKAVAAMAGNDDVAALTRHVQTIVDVAHNELDAISERAEKAGIVSELAEIKA
jgi:uncharacterized protein YunC (DUF1805 family)